MPRIHPAIVLAALGLVGVTAATIALADSTKIDSMTVSATPTPSADTIASTHMPTGYSQSARRAVTVDGEGAELVRYERDDERNAALGGEHFSTVIAENGRLKGFARIDLDLVDGQLPSREEAQAIAMDFLRDAGPDLLPGMRISWVEPHDEPLRVTRDGRTEDLTLTGMKVKMRNSADGLWMWVIVGADRKVMVFERDINWITFPGHRGTEKWLHDSWLVEKGHTLRAS